jgi:copper(I)-binding protein
MAVDAQGIMRMREIDAIAIAPREKLRMRPGAGLHLMLIGLKEPLKEDASFPMTLEFERAGKVEVKVIVGQAEARRGGGERPHALSEAPPRFATSRARATPA